METLCLLLLTLSYAAIVHSQFNSAAAAACQTPAQCNLDLRNAFFSDAHIATKTLSYAKTGSSPRFHDVRYSAETCDTMPAQTYCEDNTSVLQYHVYYPDSSVFTFSDSCKLAVFIFFHGGGFLDCGGTFDGEAVVDLCRQIARRRFIVINAEYRRGIISGSNTVYSAQQFLGIYRAAQDGPGLVRTVIKRERNKSEPYRIDTTQIFIGGQSAGSVVAMSVAYFSKQSMFDAVYPGVSSPNILGGINPTFYFGDTSIKYKIRGVANLWGGLAIPPAYLNNPEDFFSQNDTIPPMIAFQGHLDQTFADTFKVVKFAKDVVVNGVNYGKEKRCLLSSTDSFVLHPKGNNQADSYLLGEQNIYTMLRKLCKPAEYYLDSQMHHGLDNCTDTCYKSNFGVSTNVDVATTNVYMAQRITTFFQGILTDKVKLLTTTKFLECPNKRHTCNPADDNSGCPADTGGILCQ